MELRTLAAGSVLILSALSASAAFERQVIDYGSAGSPVAGGTVNLSWAGFDPSLGQLTGVTITLDSYDSAQAEVISLPGAGVGYFNASVTSGVETVNVQDLPISLSTSTDSLMAGPSSGTTAGLTTTTGSGPTQHLTASETVLSPDLPFFIGGGLQAFSVLVTPGAGTFSGSGQGSAVGFGGVFNSYGSVEIDYSYLANVVTVPEASHFSAVTGGVAGFVSLLGWNRRVRRQTA